MFEFIVALLIVVILFVLLPVPVFLILIGIWFLVAGIFNLNEVYNPQCSSC